MKTITKELKYPKTYFVASDGTEFEAKEECEKYEKTVKCVLMTKYNKLVSYTTVEEDIYSTGSDEYEIDIVSINTEEDADIIKLLMFLYNPYLEDGNHTVVKDKNLEKIDEALKNKCKLFIGRGCSCDDCFWPLDTVDSVISHMKEVCNKTKE
jgi:hypothetical protein